MIERNPLITAPLFIVKFRINKTLCAGSVRKPNLPGCESVSLFLGFTITKTLGGNLGDNMETLKNIGMIILTIVCIILLIKYISDAPPSERKWWRWPWF